MSVRPQPGEAELLHELVARRAVSDPEAIVLVDGDESVTYAQLERRAGELAGRLSALGVGPDVVVGLLMERSALMIVSVLAVLKAGGAYAALDPADPAERLASLVAAAKPSFVLTDQSSPATCQAPVHRLEQLPAAESPLRTPHSGNLAYVAYTSGSTGSPKAVGISHRGLVRTALSWLAPWGMDREPMRMVQTAASAYDVFHADVAMVLLSGGTLVFCPRETRLDAPALHGLLVREKIDIGFFTPAIVRLLLEYVEAADVPLAPLRVMNLGGEPWSVADYRRIAARLPAGTTLGNAYGLVETTVTNLFHVGGPGERAAGDGMPIGVAHDGADILVLDENLAPAGDGELGELYLAGDCVARGYLGRPGLTAARFVAHPLQPGTRMYRTGDLVRRAPGGEIEYVGRTDDQVKIRGTRVAIGEVERALSAHPRVSQAAVVHRANGVGDNTLVAHVVATGRPPLLDELRRQVTRLVCKEAAPAEYQVHSALPVGPTGKVDRAALDRKAPVGVSVDHDDTTAGALGVDAVSAVWREVLGVSGDMHGRDFFAVGGDSISAARVAARLTQRFAVHVPPRVVHEHSTVEALATWIENAAGDQPVLPRDSVTDRYPLSARQQMLWLHHRLFPRDVAYNEAVVVDLTGELRVRHLRAAIDLLVRWNSTLRTVVALHDGQPQAVVQDDWSVPFDVAATCDDDSVTEFLQSPFDLSADLPIRARVFRRGDDHVLVLALHHIAIDAPSVAILLSQLGTAYSALCWGQTPRGPRTGLSHADLVLWEARAHTGGESGRSRDYWAGKLTGCPRLRLPFDLVERATRRGTGDGERRSMTLAPDLARAIRSVADQHHSTAFVVMLAAFHLLLRRWSGQRDFAIGVPVSARDHLEAEQIVGFQVDTMAIRCHAPADATFDELVQTVHNELIAARSHQGVPFGDVLRAAGRTTADPLFRVWFDHVGSPPAAPVMHGLRTRVRLRPDAPALFDLNAYLTEVDGTFRVDVVNDPDVVTGAVADELLDQYARLLERACANPHTLLERYPLARPQDAPPPDSDPPSFCRRLVAHLARRGGDVVLTDGSTTITGTRLREHVRLLRGQLRSAGVRAGDVIMVHIGRSVRLPPVLLAVLAAGARALVVDPGHPAARLAHLAAIAQPDIVVHDEPPPGIENWSGNPALIAVLDDGRCEPRRKVSEQRPVARFRDAGYLIFTSGTTGMPECVVSSLAPVIHFLDWYCGEYQLSSDDRFALLAGLGHDPLWRDVLTPLWCGGTLCVPSQETWSSPRDLLRWLLRQRITVAHLTPPMARLLLRVAGNDGITLPALRLVCLVGDVLKESDVDGLAKLAPSATLVHGYGTTETPQLVSHWRVVPDEPVVLGPGAPGSRLLVRNEAGVRCAVGETGEIVVVGRHLADGYMDAASTAAAFTTDPTSGVRQFATGDRGRYRVDGTIEFAGRADKVVKIRGFRVHPGEVDRVLAGCGWSGGSVTVSRPVSGDDRQLVTYVVDDDVERTRGFLAERLPPHLMPAVIVPVRTLPLTVNGKIDEESLPPVPSASVGEQGPPPASATEQLVADVWAEVLDVGDVPVTTDFFTLGGTSMLMVTAQLALSSRLVRDIPLLALYENPTVRSLTAHLTGETEAVGATVGRRRSSGLTDQRDRRAAARRAMTGMA